MKRLTLAAAAIVASGMSVADTPNHILVRGMITCADWAKHRTSSTASIFEAYVLGLFDGTTMASGQNFWLTPHEINAEQAYFWMDRYCENNPLSSIIPGAFQLVRERLGEAWDQRQLGTLLSPAEEK